jgi:hypothetical protein
MTTDGWMDGSIDWLIEAQLCKTGEKLGGISHHTCIWIIWFLRNRCHSNYFFLSIADLVNTCNSMRSHYEWVAAAMVQNPGSIWHRIIFLGLSHVMLRRPIASTLAVRCFREPGGRWWWWSSWFRGHCNLIDINAVLPEVRFLTRSRSSSSGFCRFNLSELLIRSSHCNFGICSHSSRPLNEYK